MPELPSPRRPRLPSGVRLAVDEWRAFGDRRYRPYQGIGVGSAAVFALAGDGLTIPLLLALGAPPALATVIGVLPLTFSAAQLLVPSLLRRTDGNLRGVTLGILAIGETRGFVLAAIVLLHVAGLLPAGVAIAGVAAVMSLGGAASAIGGTNLLAWYGAILLEPERRFVAPRVMGITQGLGAALLLPVALGVQAGLETLGLAIYAAVFLAAGLAGLGEVSAVLRLRRPGRVRVARRGEQTRRSPETERFIRIIALAAAGAGFGPYLSIYAMSVLGAPASFAILLSAVSSAASLVAATLVGGLLNRGSASRTLRVSFVLRGGGILLALLAFPGNPAAGLLLLVVAAVVSAGAAAGTLAANERLLRLTGGVDLIGAQSRFVAGSAVGVTTGQFASAGVLALSPLLLGTPAGFGAFAILMVGSGLTRLLLATRVDVSATWSTATAAFDVAELQGTTPLPPRESPDEPRAAGWPIAIQATGRAAAPEVEAAAAPEVEVPEVEPAPEEAAVPAVEVPEVEVPEVEAVAPEEAAVPAVEVPEVEPAPEAAAVVPEVEAAPGAAAAVPEVEAAEVEAAAPPGVEVPEVEALEADAPPGPAAAPPAADPAPELEAVPAEAAAPPGPAAAPPAADAAPELEAVPAETDAVPDPAAPEPGPAAARDPDGASHPGATPAATHPVASPAAERSANAAATEVPDEAAATVPAGGILADEAPNAGAEPPTVGSTTA